jgi:hypothetical protein
MKKVLGALLVIALTIPGALSATATLGVYFGYTPGARVSSPTPFVEFEAYLYLHHAEKYVTAVEYSLVTPGDPAHAWFSITSVSYPDEKTIQYGDPFSGHSIAYWPPLNGFVPGYNLLCSYTCLTVEPCWDAGGAMIDYEIVVGPHPDSGFLRGTFAPENEFFDIIGLTSVLCAEDPVAVEEESWGTIKSMYR